MAPSKRTSSTDMVLLRTLIPRRNGITSHVLEASRAACAAHHVIAALPERGRAAAGKRCPHKCRGGSECTRE